MGRSVVTMPSAEALSRVLGTKDEVLDWVEQRVGVRVSVRGADVSIQSDDDELSSRVADLMDQLCELASRGARPSGVEIRSALDLVASGGRADFMSLAERTIVQSSRGRQIRPFTAGQRAYIDAIESNDVVFGIGPAGTGKTFLAVAAAVAALKESRTERIILVRPVVEAGEHLGYLPGDLREKIDPYIRPLYDAFGDILSPERLARHLERGIIEIAPLAYMRGRTLNNSFIILDEAQNTTKEQMKMFLTRLGLGSKAVLTGDLTQVDLPGGKQSGLRSAGEILKDIPGIAFCRLTDRDVVRHDIVQKIVRAYERYEQEQR